MKGIIFRELFEMIESHYNYELVDKVITRSELSNNGAYTSVGTYPYEEMQRILTVLSKETSISPDDLLKKFGEFLFYSFHTKFPKLFEGETNGFDFLSKIENTIHVEVLKLYPQAELPTFKEVEKTNKKLVLDYQSNRKLCNLAEGLMKSCMEHFNEPAIITKKVLDEDQTLVRFIIEKTDGK